MLSQWKAYLEQWFHLNKEILQMQNKRKLALYFHEKDFDIGQAGVMGRHSASAGMLTSLIRFGRFQEFLGLAGNAEDSESFRRFVAQVSQHYMLPLEKSGKCHPFLGGASTKLPELDVLFTPDPNLERFTNRRIVGSGKDADGCFSICGITHSLSSSNVLKILARLVVAPIMPWDALICTSRAAREVVQFCINHQMDRMLSAGIEVAKPDMQLPVIPLGVDVSRFATGNNRLNLRNKWRQKLRIGAADFVAIYFGRLSFHAKANPFPMFRAMQVVYEKTGKKLTLLMVGQFYTKYIEQSFLKAAELVCPGVTCLFLDGHNQDLASEIWYAADVFVSLPDNIQETFGLTPIEAMAAGLPCIVSDWDGYKDTVLHGVTGFRVQSYMPAAGEAGKTLIQQYILGKINYDVYIGQLSLCTAVDIPRLVEALEILLGNEILRAELSAKARLRAEQLYDWKHIIAAYDELWDELQAIRQNAGKQRSSASNHGKVLRHSGIEISVPDPFAMFARFPSCTLEKSRFVFADDIDSSRLEIWLKLGILNLGGLPDHDFVKSVFDKISKEPVEFAELCAKNNNVSRMQMEVSIGWMIKCGLLKIVDSVECIN